MEKIMFKLRYYVVLLVITLAAASCEDQNLSELSNDRNQNIESLSDQSNARARRFPHQKTYVLVHGAWHPESSWNEVRFLLEHAGHKVITVQLQGLGNDPTPVETVAFQDHVSKVENTVAQQTGAVILVGHSYAGAVISQVGEDIPQRIQKLIYVSGFMLADSETVGQWALADTASLVTQNLLIDPAGTIAYLTTENYGKALYNVALQGNAFMAWQAKKIISQLRPHPLATLFTPVHLGANFRGLEKVYISCLRDKAVTPPTQRAMYSRFPETRVFFLRGSDHSPFVSAPIELATLLR
jgi:pimeloyl-ACP methyl ester carboxylesterase